jgi:Astacin (Peptidase family M12A)
MSDIHMCIDKGDLSDVYDKKSGAPGPIAVDVRFKWPEVGKTFKIKFLEGDPYVIGKVKEKFDLWLPYASRIKYEYVADGDADVRIAFNPDQGSWSYVGKEILNIPQDEPTMNYGWFDKNTPDAEFERVSVHEMGHTLGFIHEQSQPLAEIDWDLPKVFEFFKRTNGWDEETTRHNVLERYSKKITQFTQYDPTSIMHYWFPGEILKSGKDIEGGNKLSELDKTFAKTLYGQE